MTLVGTAGLLGLNPEPLAAEPPKTTTLSLIQFTPASRDAPPYVAEESLRSEGFTKVQYIKMDEYSEYEIASASGKADINMSFAPDAVIRLEAGDPIVI
jgi:NitT/TauT family transport system substrate-binding protein